MTIPEFVMSAALSLAGALIFRHVCKSHAAGVGLTVFGYVLTAICVEPVHFEAAGFNFFLQELIALALIAATAARIVVRPQSRRHLGAAVPFAVTTAMAFVLGAAWHGVKPAGVEYREAFSVCAAILYVASFPLDGSRMRQLVKIWMAGACVLTGVAWFRWAAGALQLSITSQWASINGEHYWRVLSGGQAFYLAQSLLVLLYLRRNATRPGWLSMSIGSLAITVLVLQHRSVYVAVIAGVAIMAWREGAWREGVLRHLPRAAALAGALLLLVYVVQPEWISRENRLREALTQSMEEPFDLERSTFVWRVNMWQAYLLEYAALPTWQKSVGTGFGNPAVYRIDSGDVQVAAHSEYVYLLNRTGAIGLAAFLAYYGLLLRRIRGTAGRWDYLGMLLTLAISQLVYCTVYSISCDQGLLAGAALGISPKGDRRRVA